VQRDAKTIQPFFFGEFDLDERLYALRREEIR
jgi:hypothetical protein